MKPSWEKIPILPILPISRMLCIWGREPQIEVLLIEYRAFTPSAVVITRYCIPDPTTSCRKLEPDQHVYSTQTHHHVGLQGPISDRGGVCRIYTHPPMSLRRDAEKLPRRCGSLDGKSDRLQLYKWQVDAEDWPDPIHLAFHALSQHRQWSPRFLFRPRIVLLPGNTDNNGRRCRSHAQCDWMLEPHDFVLIRPDTSLAGGGHLQPAAGVAARYQRWLPRLQNDIPSHGRDVQYRNWRDGHCDACTSMGDSCTESEPGPDWILVFRGELHYTWTTIWWWSFAPPPLHKPCLCMSFMQAVHTS